MHFFRTMHSKYIYLIRFILQTLERWHFYFAFYSLFRIYYNFLVHINLFYEIWMYILRLKMLIKKYCFYNICFSRFFFDFSSAPNVNIVLFMDAVTYISSIQMWFLIPKQITTNLSVWIICWSRLIWKLNHRFPFISVPIQKCVSGIGLKMHF